MLLGLLKDVQKARSLERRKDTNGVTLKEENNVQNRVSLKPCEGSKISPLKLIIMSASLDARGFSEYFGGARAVHIQGRQYPVDILYTHNAEPDYVDAALITIFQVFNGHYNSLLNFFLSSI